ncbi:O-antigen ligase family protein [Massilia horti]|uniref:O-antigen ligase domain-containing protein n=1 Tax=Massilia horti TaxID=2562153 RepID=A0A4Y9T6F6_9BURK|nr:O-antigen ligase family protein [Massilia horti]TFW34381.1 O-antigen ligase domain-containing protein [Massilia horti]
MKPFRAKPAAGLEPGTLLLLLLALGLAGLVVGLAATLGPIAALAVPPALVLLAAALRDYRVATGLTILLLPVAPSGLIPRAVTGISGANVMLCLLLVTASALLLAFALRAGRLALPAFPRPFFLFLAVFVAAALHGAFHADEIPDFLVVLRVIDSTSVPTYLQVALLNPSVVIGAAVLVAVAVRNAARPSLYLVPLFGGAAIVACAVLYFSLASGASLGELGSQESRRTLSVTGMHANELGLLLSTAWALALFCALHRQRAAARLALALVALLVLAGIALTFSRGAYLGALGVLAYLLYVQRRLATFLLTLLVLPAAVLVMPASVTDRAFHAVGSKDVDMLSSGRVDEIWTPLLPEILKSPLIGSGTGSVMWSDANKEHQILPVGHPHSAYLGALLDLGVLGSLAVGVFFVHAWRLFRRLAASAPDPLWGHFFNGGAACILVLLIQGATDDSFLPGRTHTLLWLAYGAAVGYAGRAKLPTRRARAPLHAAEAS